MGPSDPEQAGSRGVQHDDRPDSSHEEELRKADRGGTSVSREDEREGSSEKTSEDSYDEDDE